MSLIENLENHFAAPLDEKGFEIVEITYQANKGEMILHFSLDRKEGKISLDDIVQLSDWLSSELDQLDLIQENYTLDISSPGAERPIQPHQLERYIGQYIHVHLMHPYQGENILEGTLLSVSEEQIDLEITNKSRKKTITLDRNNMDRIRLAIRF